MQLHSWVRYGNLESVRARLEHMPPDKSKGEGATLLGIAAKSRYANVDMLQLLVEHGANVNEIVSQLEGTPLSIAAKSGNVDKVRFLLQAGADPHFRTSSGYTPLLQAVFGPKQTRLNVVHLLLDSGASPNVVTSYGESPLGTAIHSDDFETLRILLDAGADAGILNWNPLMHAIAFGTKDDMQTELQRGANPSEDRWRGMTPWMLCVRSGDVSKAEKLLEFGAQVDSSDLFMAVHKDNPEMVKWLLSNGADIKVRDRHDQGTVLSKAAERSATTCVKLLIEAGADVRAEDQFRLQPISLAATPEIARMLVEAGADINFFDGEGYTRLKSAAERDDVEMVRALLDLGADTDAESKYYSTTPLYVAVNQDNLEIARLLLKAGANPNAQNVDLWFPLTNAQSIEMARLLLDYGADIHLTDEGGMDALQYQRDPEVAAYLIDAGAFVNPPAGAPLRQAAQDGNLEKMRLLLQRGANVDQTMSWGETALMRAAEQSFVEGVRLLLDHHANIHLKGSLEEDIHGRTALFYAAAPEGFASYDLMKKYGGNHWLDSLPEEDRAFVDKLNLDLTQYQPTYGYVASDSVEVMEMLLSAGANINERDRQEMTPLILASSCGRPARVAALLRAGADIHLRDAEGKTALDHAHLHPEPAHREAIVHLLGNAETH